MDFKGLVGYFVKTVKSICFYCANGDKNKQFNKSKQIIIYDQMKSMYGKTCHVFQ